VKEIVRKTGQAGMPVIKIGSAWIIGFDRDRIDKELAHKAS
jgi:glutaredoxin 3